MAGVEFNDNRDDVMIYEKPSRGLNALVQKMGLAKSERGANVVLIILTIIFFLAAIGVYIYFFVPSIIFHAPQPGTSQVRRRAVQQTTP
jgi:hypothetical protein